MALKWNRLLRGICIGLLIWGAIVGGLIAFGTAKPPTVAPNVITKPFADIDTQALPELLRYKARDAPVLSRVPSVRQAGGRTAARIGG